MKFLVLSDLHGSINQLDKLDDEFSKADAVIFAGDFAECFKPETGKPALEKLCQKHETIFAVLGNCDNEDFLEEIENQDISVEKSFSYYEGLSFSGSGGGSKFTGETEFERTEEELLSDFDIVQNSVEQTGDENLWGSLVLISHNPPKACVCDKVNETLHAGSQMFTDYINKNQPLAVICGHIHEGYGTEKIGKTVVINPGSLSEGKYATMEINKSINDEWTVEKIELKKL